MPLTFRRFSLLALLALLAAFAPQARPAHAATTLHVTTTADSGAGSLRAAMTSAQNGDTIVFDNNGSLWTIVPQSPLPPLDQGGVIINGGAGHQIVLDGSQARDPNNGGMVNSNGISITSAGNMIKGLVITKFSRTDVNLNTGGSGIYIGGVGATGNHVIDCWLGVAADGATAAGNSDWGVIIDDGAIGNVIGGTNAGEGNVISGNGKGNVAIHQIKSNSSLKIQNNSVVGNYIGTNASGTAVIGGSGNPGDGVLLGSWAQNNTVGGTTAAARNVIAGHTANTFVPASGVNIAGSSTRPNQNNVVIGNYIGVGADGTTRIPNQTGVQLGGTSGTTIGGAASGARNIIAGNNSAGVLVQNTGTNNNTITNNWIGLDALGNPRGNQGEGVWVKLNATTTTIGPGNVVSANGASNSVAGVRLSTGNNVVKGNFIGTNTTGTAASASLANTYASLWIDAGTQNTVGGTTGVDRNVIALGSSGTGILISGPASSATVQGNYIGVNVSGTTPLNPSPTSTSNGILINQASTNNVIGGATASARNVIAKNGIGIEVDDSGTTGNQIKGNYIGVDANGQPLGNVLYGVRLLNGPTGNTIGGTAAGEGNLIANNTSQGISVDGGNNNTIAGNTVRDNTANGVRVTSATGIKITQTATSGNGGDGIKLVGGNNGIAAPSNLQFATPSGIPTLTGNACANCVIEVFTGATRDDGEGPRYLTTTTANGSGVFSVNVSGCDPFLTATARDTSNNTSPFTNPMIDAGNGCVAATPDIQLGRGVPVSSSGAPHPVAPGGSVVYSHLLTNTGTLAGNFSISRTTSQGWAAQPNLTSVTLNPGQSRTILITVTVPLGTAHGVVDTTTVTASVSGKPPQSQSDYTGVPQTFGVNIAPDRNGSVTPGPSPVFIDYTHYITNTGNGLDSFSLTATHKGAPSVSLSFPDGQQCANLAAGAACVRRVRVTVAANSTDLADTATVTATSQLNPATFDKVTDVTQIAQAPIPQISSGTTKNALPPATVVFTHTVKNIGGASGTFTVTVSSPPANWNFALSPPTSFPLIPGASRVVTLTVTVPVDADANTDATAHLQVVASSGAPASADDTVHVLLKPAFSFSAATQPTVSNAQPGQTVIFTHTLTNQANGADSFTIALTSTAGLSNLNVVPANPINLVKGQSVQVVVSAKIVNGTLAGQQTIGVTAQRTSSPQMPILRVDTVNVQGAAVPQLSSTASQIPTLPLPRTITFTHTLTNIGNQAGNFTVGATAPAGWSAVTSTPSCLNNLQPNSTCQFTVQVTVPLGAYAGPNSVVVTASTTAPPASASVIDIVNVPAIPGLQFAPNRNGNADPGAVVTYTHTLTNSGNITDSFSITFQTDAGWSAIASSAIVANVPRGGVRSVQVIVTAPSGVAAGSTGTVTATATSALAPSLKQSVIDQTTINAKAGATLTPPMQTLSANPTDTLSDTVTFVHILRNSGSIPMTYTLQTASAPITTWATVVTPTPVGPLAPGAQATIYVRVTVPANTPFGDSTVTTIHVRQQNSPATDLTTARDTTLVGPQFGALLTPAVNKQSVLPGATAIYTHTLKNRGAQADTFVLSTIAPNGWNTHVAPTSVDLLSNGSTVVTVTVQAPTSAFSDTLDLAVVRAQSVGDNTAFGSAQEQTTVRQVAGVSLSPPRFRMAIPGRTISFEHTLVNIGNGLDTFALKATISGTGVLTWPVTITPLDVTLLPGDTYPVVIVKVTVPPDAAPTAAGHIIVTATSRSNAAVKDMLEDVIGGPGQIAAPPNIVYLPVVAR